MIHETAIVAPTAELGKDVSIGPYSIIEGDVQIGNGVVVGSHVVIKGPTTIGEGTKISQFSSIGEAPQHAGYKNEPTRLEIGSRNIIREFCTLNRGSTDGDGITRIGDDNFLMAYTHVAHDCKIGNKTILANCASLAGHVVIEDYAILGGFTLVHQFCRIGAHCMTAINSVIYKDVPPYVMTSGNPAKPHGLNTRGLKRRGFSEDAISAIRRAYKIIYRSGMRLEEAIGQLEAADDSAEVAYFLNFIKASKRSIVR